MQYCHRLPACTYIASNFRCQFANKTDVPFQLGTEAHDVKAINDKSKALIVEVRKKRMEQTKEFTLNSKLQPGMPKID